LAISEMGHYLNRTLTETQVQVLDLSALSSVW
jgi:hypothetical protein